MSYMDFDWLVTKIAHEIAFTRSSLDTIQEISYLWVANRDEVPTIKCGRHWLRPTYWMWVDLLLYPSKHLEHEATIALHTKLWMKKSQNMLVWLSEIILAQHFFAHDANAGKRRTKPKTCC
jgi:hypothetical protein